MQIIIGGFFSKNEYVNTCIELKENTSLLIFEKSTCPCPPAEFTSGKVRIFLSCLAAIATYSYLSYPNFLTEFSLLFPFLTFQLTEVYQNSASQSVFRGKYTGFGPRYCLFHLGMEQFSSKLK